MGENVVRKLKTGEDDRTIPSAEAPQMVKKTRRVRKIVPPQVRLESTLPEQPAQVVPVAETLAAAAPPEEPEDFPCLKCGIMLEAHTCQCPICGERYLDLPKEALDELEKAEADEPETLDGASDQDTGAPPCVLFDADEGVIDFLEKDSKAFEVALICSECGTALEFATDRCPLCGASMDSPDAGLVGLVSEMTFDGDASEEMVCPQCGEQVRLAKGKCPECKALIVRSDQNGRSARLDPIVHGDNVVFLHLDVMTGELSYLQRAVKKEGFEKMTLRLEAA